MPKRAYCCPWKSPVLFTFILIPGLIKKLKDCRCHSLLSLPSRMKRRPGNHSYVKYSSTIQDHGKFHPSRRRNDTKWNAWLCNLRIVKFLAFRRDYFVAMMILFITLLLIFQVLYSAHWIHQQSGQQQQRKNSIEENFLARETILLNATMEKSEANNELRAVEDKLDLNAQTSDGALQRHVNRFSYQTFGNLEDSFLQTLKSSLTGVVTINLEQVAKRLGKNNMRGTLKRNKLVKRIGILAPPGFIGTIATKWIREHIRKIKAIEKNKLTETEDVILSIIPSSHAPPYGYGKNHGMHKIVRFTTIPILFAVTDMMMFTLAYNGPDVEKRMRSFLLEGSNGDLLQTVLGGMLRQYVRWHCRLSHVAAHTAVQTIFLSPESLQQHPEAFIQNVTQFIFQNPQDRIFIDTHVSIEIPQHEKLKLMEHIRNIELYTSDRNQHWDNNCLHGDSSLHCILQNELDSTHHFQDWPCRSLWENVPRQQVYISNVTVNHTNVKDLLLFQTAHRLGPECGTKYVKCTVQEDLCKEAADLSMCT